MTLVFYVYYVAQEWCSRAWNGFVDWWKTTPAQEHVGADEAFADTLHQVAGTMEIPVISLEEEDIDAALELSESLKQMERSTLDQFNAGFEEAMAKFLAGGPFGEVTNTGELLMVQMEMSVWTNQQVDQIRNLGAEVTRECRETWGTWEDEEALQS